MFHKNKMGSIIRSTGTVFYSLVYINSRRCFNGLKHVYSVISVIVDSLPGDTKNRKSTRSWTARVRLVYPWAGSWLHLFLFILMMKRDLLSLCLDEKRDYYVFLKREDIIREDIIISYCYVWMKIDLLFLCLDEKRSLMLMSWWKERLLCLYEQRRRDKREKT